MPVYGLGHYADGRPFYAMRFIRGDSLKEAIERFHAARSSPAASRASGRWRCGSCSADSWTSATRWPMRTAGACLHRDLKPGNIMLGQYGETLVVDWGLAKVVGTVGGRRRGRGRRCRPSSASGLARRCPARRSARRRYMSPEQAAGRLDQLGPASDVYSLGATLYCLLTGKRADRGRGTSREILSRVKRGEFPPPRRLEPDVPRALEAVCLKAMALEPEDRYQSPRGLAEDIERWLADEPVTAWREPILVGRAAVVATASDAGDDRGRGRARGAGGTRVRLPARVGVQPDVAEFQY